MIEEAILAWIGFPNIEKILAEYEQRLKDPSVQLDHKYNPYMKGQNNFAEFKTYMDKYAEEQKILSETTASAIINGNDGGRFDIVLDSDFEAFYNTITMFKLILMGPENFKTFVKELSGKTPLEAANTPNMDKMAAEGITGIMDSIAPGIIPGSDTAHLSILGYNPYEVYTGRGPFEANGVGVDVLAGDIAFRWMLHDRPR